MKRARSRSESRFYLIEYAVKPEHRTRLKAADRPNFEDIANIVDRGGGDIVASREISLNYEESLQNTFLAYAGRRAKDEQIEDRVLIIATAKQIEMLPDNSKTKNEIRRNGIYIGKNLILDRVYKELCEFIGDFHLNGTFSYYESLIEKDNEIKADKTFSKMKRYLNEITGVNNRYIKDLDHWYRLDPQKGETSSIRFAFHSSKFKFLEDGYIFGKTVHYERVYYWTKKLGKTGRYWIYKTP